MTVYSSCLNRRQALAAFGTLGWAAAVSPLLGGRVHGPPMLGMSLPTHYRVKLGNFELTAISDGVFFPGSPYPIFGANDKPENVHEVLRDNMLPHDRLQLPIAPIVVNTGKALVLFDAGYGSVVGASAGAFVSNLAGAGYTPDQIDIVVISHCHGDHIGGLIGPNGPNFPNARYVIAEEEYRFWTAPELLSGDLAKHAGLTQEQVVPLKDRIVFVRGNTEVTHGVFALEAFGHTPGHLVFHVESEGQRMLIWADIAVHQVLNLQRPDWYLSYDVDREKAAVMRKRIFDMAATERMTVHGYHMTFPGFGFVERKDLAYRWVPASDHLTMVM
jgi:glyoxylase-like metal-dependent hydrolase (beta-lactamase superfamily II)